MDWRFRADAVISGQLCTHGDAVMCSVEGTLSGFISTTSRLISNHSNLKLMLHYFSQTCWSQVPTGGLW